MKRKPSLVALKGLAAALAIIAASTVVDAQVTVSVPFKFEAGGKSSSWSRLSDLRMRSCSA